jgi:hypothetical protein
MGTCIEAYVQVNDATGRLEGLEDICKLLTLLSCFVGK